MFEIKVSDEMGRGLYATERIETGHHIMACELLVLDEADTFTVNLTSLKYYTFTYNDKQDCLVLGQAELLNHSGTPNVSYSLIEKDGRFVMVFKALEPIEVGAQLFIDYNADARVNTANYLLQNSLMG